MNPRRGLGPLEFVAPFIILLAGTFPIGRWVVPLGAILVLLWVFAQAANPVNREFHYLAGNRALLPPAVWAMLVAGHRNRRENRNRRHRISSVRSGALL